jgi:hypothetical protein
MKRIPAMIYSRCCGYYTNYEALHAGKKAEWDERKTIYVSKLGESIKLQRNGIKS